MPFMRTAIRLLPFLLLVATPAVLSAQDTIARAVDTSVQQQWTSHYAFRFLLPNKARFNKLGSVLNEAGQSEVTNFILPGGCGSITIRYFAEGRIVPKGYRLLDSVHVWDSDSTGRNGQIHRRLYILTDIAIELEVLLTAKGEAEYGPVLSAIRDGFTPPAGAPTSLPLWRYGRNPSEFEQGRSPEYHQRNK